MPDRPFSPSSIQAPDTPPAALGGPVAVARVEEPAVTTVTVVGGGVAGLSAACALAGAGFRVTVLERRGYLGGRASSYLHPGTGEAFDNSQHVFLRCCTT